MLGWILAMLVAIAGVLLFFEAYTGANVCFILTALFVFSKVAHATAISDDPIWHRLLFTFVLFGLCGIAIVETVRGVNKWAARHTLPEQKSVVTSSQGNSEHPSEQPGTADSIEAIPQHPSTESSVSTKVEHPKASKLAINKEQTPKYRAIALSDEMFKWLETERRRVADFQEYVQEVFGQYPQKFEPQATELTEKLKNCGADTEKLQRELREAKGDWHSITSLEGIGFELKNAAHSIPDGQPECGTGEPVQGFGEKDTGVYMLLIGTSETGYYKEDLERGPGTTKLGGKHILKIYLRNETFCIDAKVYGGFEMPLIDVVCNRIKEPPMGWDINFTEKAIEVVNENQIPMFQMIFEGNRRIRVNGVFPGENNELFIHTPQGTNRINLNEHKTIEISLKRLFKYPAWKFPHQYVD